MIGGMNPFIVGGKDIRIFRKPTKDSWGDVLPTYSGITLENVAVAPRTSATEQGEGFRGRVQSGYTLYLDHEQTALVQPNDEFEIVMPDGTKAYYVLDGFEWGANWDNPLSCWQPGDEVNLKFTRAEVPS